MRAVKTVAKRVIRFAFDHAPNLTGRIWEGVRWVILRKERQGFVGRGPEVKGELSSVVFFTQNRCASMMLHKRICDLMAGCGLREINYQRLAHPWSEEKRDTFRWALEEHQALGRFRARMHYYGPFRYYVDIPELESFKTILVLRDPRDVITSRYYSEAYAHVALDKRFHDHTRAVREMDVDEFVRAFAGDVERDYRQYMDHHGKLQHGIFRSYEDVIADFEGFLWDVNEYCGFGQSREDVCRIAAQESFEVDREDKYSHKRSVKAGAYQRKLKPETITYIDDLFRDVLEFFGWDGEGSKGAWSAHSPGSRGGLTVALPEHEPRPAEKE